MSISKGMGYIITPGKIDELDVYISLWIGLSNVILSDGSKLV